jgi:hypothetical protein
LYVTGTGSDVSTAELVYGVRSASGKNSGRFFMLEPLCGDCSLLDHDAAKSGKILKVEGASFFETFLPLYHSTASHFPEDIDLYIHGC